MSTAITLSHVKDATRLLVMSMTSGVNAIQNKEYQLLLQQYGTVPEFMQVVQHAAEGLGLHVIEADIRNLYLRAENKDSPFAYRVTDFRNLQASQRAAYFLCMVSLAATFFPNPQALAASGTLKPLMRKELHDDLNEHIAAWSTTFSTTTTSNSIKTGLSSLIALPPHPLKTTQAGQYRGGHGSRNGLLEIVINDLKEQNFLRVEDKTTPEHAQVYPTHKFRQHLGAEDGAIAMLMSILKKDSDE